MVETGFAEGEDELIRVQTDLNEKGDFGNQWVVVTRNRVLVRQNGAIADIPISEIELARTEALVGGARLEIHRKNKPTIHVPYSLTQAQKFSETTRGIEQLRKGKNFLLMRIWIAQSANRVADYCPKKMGYVRPV